MARSQGAKLWELNAAISYARLLSDRGRSADAQALLAAVHAWFTEGFDTVPLRSAKALLDELERGTPARVTEGPFEMRATAPGSCRPRSA